jgi:hypothetical protein
MIDAPMRIRGLARPTAAAVLGLHIAFVCALSVAMCCEPEASTSTTAHGAASCCRAGADAQICPLHKTSSEAGRCRMKSSGGTSDRAVMRVAGAQGLPLPLVVLDADPAVSVVAPPTIERLLDLREPPLSPPPRV